MIAEKVFDSDVGMATKSLQIYKDFISYSGRIANFMRSHQFISEFQGPSVADFSNKVAIFME